MEFVSASESKHNLASLQQMHSDVRGLLALALDHDEKNEHADAIQLYQQVSLLIQQALGLKILESDRRNIANIQERLQRHLEAVEDRLKILKQKKPSLWTSVLSAFNSFTEKSLGGAFPDEDDDDIVRLDVSSAEFDDSLLPHVPSHTQPSGPPRNMAVTYVQQPPLQRPAQQPKGVSAVAARAPVVPPAHVPSHKTQQPQQNSTKTNDAALQAALKTIDAKLKEAILNEIIQDDTGVEWDDVVGLGEAKRTIEETVILPLVRPDLFSGLRTPPRGVLLYGPPGNGKTMIAKALARRGKARFFCVSASLLTSKWLGEGEKLVKALFLIARYVQPAVIFVDEIDSLLSSRRGEEHEASRRLKTEFLVQMDGAMTSASERVLVLAATNRPFDLDEAILRRLVKRIYVPLPDKLGREAMMKQLLRTERVSLGEQQYRQLIDATSHMSYSDLKALCAEAAMAPLRDLSQAELLRIDANQIRPIGITDFASALKRIRPSTGAESIRLFEEWTSKFGVAS